MPLTVHKTPYYKLFVKRFPERRPVTVPLATVRELHAELERHHGPRHTDSVSGFDGSVLVLTDDGSAAIE
ncbi:hypothetical protein [Cellulosimicrobium cellulans]|uniref:hypothetical protein n=1 Tax=Cellulosimicrobium cellulans TaxID=1710 RepID=UPI002404FAD3|nr:hypothetical protein [Cellulosimicrobium cellulans]MDF9878702.1 hypothetical protein [Cellulosimicrobium cellulans]